MASVAEVLSHRGARLAALGWSAFVAENVALSHNRDAVIGALGGSEAAYVNAYSACSTACIGSVAYAFAAHCYGRGPRQFAGNGAPPAARAVAAAALQAAGLVMLSQQLPPLAPAPAIADASAVPAAPGARAGKPQASASKCPVPLWLRGGAAKPDDETHRVNAAADVAQREAAPQASASKCPVPLWMRGGAAKPYDATHAKLMAAVPSESTTEASGVTGVKRVTRHAAFWSLGLTGLGAAVGTPFAAEAVVYAGPALVALVGGAHQDYRYRRGWGGTLDPETDAATSLLPFAALLDGRQSWARLVEELDVTNAHVGLLVATALAALRAARRV